MKPENELTGQPSEDGAPDQPTREDMTELMKAHLDMIEGGFHFSAWFSKI